MKKTEVQKPQLQKLKAQHLKSFQEAIVVAESIAKERAANICFYAGSNRVEMNRMIAANNSECAQFTAVYEKFYDHFEAQFLTDLDIEPFSDTDVSIMEQLFKIKTDSMSKAKDDLLRYSTDNMVSFSITAEISRVSFVYQDIIDIVKEHYMLKK
jgi:hypothetical protein